MGQESHLLGGKEWRPRKSEGYSFLFSLPFAPSIHSFEVKESKSLQPLACPLVPNPPIRPPPTLGMYSPLTRKCTWKGSLSHLGPHNLLCDPGEVTIPLWACVFL